MKITWKKFFSCLWYILGSTKKLHVCGNTKSERLQILECNV